MQQPESTYDRTWFTTLFIGLLVIEILIIIFAIIAGTVVQVMMYVLIRVILLLITYCCEVPSWAVFYSIFALFGALITFDPVGLFIIGRTHYLIQMEIIKQSSKTFYAFLL